MFQFGGFPSATYLFSYGFMILHHVCSHMCVPTFGYLRLIAYLQLPAAFRSLSRPSSAPNAKAFSICSSSLELLKYFNTFCISFDIHRFSSLELLCFILAVNIFRYSDKIVFFYPKQKNLISFSRYFCFSLYFCLSCMPH